MANTYSQLYIQIIFAVKDRNALIKECNRDEIEKYIYGIVNNHKCKPLAIYCNPDHTHLLVGLHPSVAISDLVRDLKASSSTFIKNKFKNSSFSWQEGYASFSYSRSQIDLVIKYIHNQPKHHAKRGFKEEFLDMLRKLEIEYNEEYLFNWI